MVVKVRLPDKEKGTVTERASRDRNRARMPDWDWLSEKDVNAFLIHRMSQMGR